MEFQPLDTFVLFLIGLGPIKVLMVFLAVTTGQPEGVRRQLVLRMVTVAAVVAGMLILFGEFIANLLHLTEGSLLIAGGIILLIVALGMITGGASHNGEGEAAQPDPAAMVVYPLAIPLMLNPVGIVALIVTPANVGGDLGNLLLIIVFAAIVLALDAIVLLSAGKLDRFLNPGRVAVIEVVLGILVAALAVQLVLEGLAEAGVVTLTSH